MAWNIIVNTATKSIKKIYYQNPDPTDIKKVKICANCKEEKDTSDFTRDECSRSEDKLI